MHQAKIIKHIGSDSIGYVKAQSSLIKYGALRFEFLSLLGTYRSSVLIILRADVYTVLANATTAEHYIKARRIYEPCWKLSTTYLINSNSHMEELTKVCTLLNQHDLRLLCDIKHGLHMLGGTFGTRCK